MADTDLIERLKFHGRYATETQAECAERKNAEREEAATTLAEKDARIAELANHVVFLRDALGEDRRSIWRDAKLSSSAEEAVETIEEWLSDARRERDASRAECEGLRQKHVDANEALIDTEQALVRIADAMVPGLARRLAREALPVVRAALDQKEAG